MRLRQRGKIWYAYWTENVITQRNSLRTENRALAEQRLADEMTTPTGATVADIMEAYMIEKDASAARPDRIRTAWKALGPWFGWLRPDQVTRAGCREYATGRRGLGRQNGTINKELSILRAALRWHDPQTRAIFELPSPPPPRDRHLNREEYMRLLECAETPHLRLFIQVALATGGRHTAILELTYDHVDFKREIIDLGNGEGRRKGRAVVPMTKALKEHLLEARTAAQTTHVIEYAGGPIKSIKKSFKRACRRAGLHDVSPHVLRHTSAVWMAESGVTMPEIAAYLGHADSRITERVYAKFSPDFLRRASAALEV